MFLQGVKFKWTSINVLNWSSACLIALLAELVIYGEFLDVTNSTNEQNTHITDVRINTAVYCVLKNVKGEEVPATIIIEDTKSDFDGRCINNLYNLKTAVRMVRYYSILVLFPWPYCYFFNSLDIFWRKKSKTLEFSCCIWFSNSFPFADNVC